MNTTITIPIQDKLKFGNLLNKYRKLKFSLTNQQLFKIMVKVMDKYDPEISDEVKKLK